MSSLQNLPTPLQDEIACLVASSSIQAMEDLRSLRATCKAMIRAYKSLLVHRGLPLRRVLYHAFDGNDRYSSAFIQLHDTLVARLSSDEVINSDACYLAGLREVFVDNRIALRPSLHLHERAAAAYMLGLCLYAGDDDNVFQLIRKVEGEEEEAAVVGASGRIQLTRWRSLECVCCRHQIEVDLARLLLAALPVRWDMEDGVDAR